MAEVRMRADDAQSGSEIRRANHATPYNRSRVLLGTTTALEGGAGTPRIHLRTQRRCLHKLQLNDRVKESSNREPRLVVTPAGLK